VEVIERAYGSAEPFDYDGRYYQLKGVVSRPPSVQVPRPVTMNAAFGAPGGISPRGAATTCSPPSRRSPTAAPRRGHRGRGRGGGARGRHLHRSATWSAGRPTAEAEDYYDKYAVAEADHAAVDYHMATKKEFSGSHDREAYDLYRQRFAGGAGSYPLIGTPETIVEELSQIADEGYAGAALTFVNYSYELPFFCDRVLPLMKQAGLRVN
jgi:alkanesulfonate monooxygenase SsuD/methylene tetrahydromethanopterin reductase-like flavin-dependent oxidoreductase (luciferase family)